MNMTKYYAFLVFLLSLLCPYVGAEHLSLFTDTGWQKDSNWDVWQQDPCYPEVESEVVEDVIYLCVFDGAGGHTNHAPDDPVDGIVDGCYSTFTMETGGPDATQSLNVSGVNIQTGGRFEQRDTRVITLVNLAKIKRVNENPGAILNGTFRWSIDYVMPWVGTSIYLKAPTRLYISIFPAELQEFYHHPPDNPADPNTALSELQDEFDPNSAGLMFAEKELDIRVEENPWGLPGMQPLSNWNIEQDGVHFYEMDFTAEIRQIIKQHPDLKWLGFTIRLSRDGHSVNLSLDATLRLSDNPIPPTLDVTVREYLGDINNEQDEQQHVDGVDMEDFALLSGQWLRADGFMVADLDVDGIVDIADLLLFSENWLMGNI